MAGTVVPFPLQSVDNQVLLGADSGWNCASAHLASRCKVARDTLLRVQTTSAWLGCDKLRVIRTWVLPLLFGCESVALPALHTGA